jgi:hypothetical protein
MCAILHSSRQREFTNAGLRQKKHRVGTRGTTRAASGYEETWVSITAPFGSIKYMSHSVQRDTRSRGGPRRGLASIEEENRCVAF